MYSTRYTHDAFLVSSAATQLDGPVLREVVQCWYRDIGSGTEPPIRGVRECKTTDLATSTPSPTTFLITSANSCGEEGIKEIHYTNRTEGLSNGLLSLWESVSQRLRELEDLPELSCRNQTKWEITTGSRVTWTKFIIGKSNTLTWHWQAAILDGTPIMEPSTPLPGASTVIKGEIWRITPSGCAISAELHLFLYSRIFPLALRFEDARKLATAFTDNFCSTFTADTWLRHWLFEVKKGLMHTQMHLRYFSRYDQTAAAQRQPVTVKLSRQRYDIKQHASSELQTLSFMEQRVSLSVWVSICSSTPHFYCTIASDSEESLEQELHNDRIWHSVDGHILPCANRAALSLTQAALFLAVRFWAERSSQTLDVLKQHRHNICGLSEPQLRGLLYSVDSFTNRAKLQLESSRRDYLQSATFDDQSILVKNWTNLMEYIDQQEKLLLEKREKLRRKGFWLCACRSLG